VSSSATNYSATETGQGDFRDRTPAQPAAAQRLEQQPAGRLADCCFVAEQKTADYRGGLLRFVLSSDEISQRDGCCSLSGSERRVLLSRALRDTRLLAARH